MVAAQFEPSVRPSIVLLSASGYYQYKQDWGASHHHLQAVTVLSDKISSDLAPGRFLFATRVHHLWNRIWFCGCGANVPVCDRPSSAWAWAVCT